MQKIREKNIAIHACFLFLCFETAMIDAGTMSVFLQNAVCDLFVGCTQMQDIGAVCPFSINGCTVTAECFFRSILHISSQRVAEKSGLLSFFSLFCLIDQSCRKHNMNMKIMRSVGHGTDLIMNGECVVMIRKVCLNESVHDLHVLL